MILGLLLIAAALFLTGYNIWESKQAEKASDLAVKELFSQLETPKDTVSQEISDYELFPEKEMPFVEIDGEQYIGILEFPDLNLQLPVMAGKWSYAKLKKAPCRYEGSVYQDNLVIAGHNYRSHFSKIKNLDIGDEVRFTDTDGNEFVYQVEWVDILQKTDVSEMTEKDGWDMTLFTCTYGGEERYTVRCIKAE